MSGESRDVCVQSPKFTHANPTNPAKRIRQKNIRNRFLGSEL